MRSKSVKTSVMAICAAMLLTSPMRAHAAEPASEIVTAEDLQTQPAQMPDAAAMPAEALGTQPVPAEAPEMQPVPSDLLELPPEKGLDGAELPSVPADSETALLLAEQTKAAQQGYALDKYHMINILGDSLTEGVGARLTGAKVNNYGVSGSRITDISVGYTNPGSFVDRMYSMEKTADLVIVFGGTNDFWFGDCPIGERTDSKPNTFYGALNTMPYQQSKDADETHSYQRSTYGDYGSGTFSQYRVAMLDRCQYYNIPVLDLYADYELNMADNREALEMYGNYLCDGCHLNDAGYNLLARKLYQFIMQDFSQYVPAYTTVNNMVFETAALPALIQNGNFVMPDGQVIPVKEGFAADPAMPLQQLYQTLIVSAMD